MSVSNKLAAIHGGFLKASNPNAAHWGKLLKHLSSLGFTELELMVQKGIMLGVFAKHPTGYVDPKGRRVWRTFELTAVPQVSTKTKTVYLEISGTHYLFRKGYDPVKINGKRVTRELVGPEATAQEALKVAEDIIVPQLIQEDLVVLLDNYQTTLDKLVASSPDLRKV